MCKGPDGSLPCNCMQGICVKLSWNHARARHVPAPAVPTKRSGRHAQRPAAQSGSGSRTPPNSRGALPATASARTRGHPQRTGSQPPTIRNHRRG